jgi:hypothetical protein
MRRAWLFLTNRVILGMVFFLLLMALWDFTIRPAYFPQSLVEESTR